MRILVQIIHRIITIIPLTLDNTSIVRKLKYDQCNKNNDTHNDTRVLKAVQNQFKIVIFNYNIFKLQLRVNKLFFFKKTSFHAKQGNKATKQQELPSFRV